MEVWWELGMPKNFYYVTSLLMLTSTQINIRFLIDTSYSMVLAEGALRQPQPIRTNVKFYARKVHIERLYIQNS